MCSLWPHCGGICYSRWAWGWVRSPWRQKACQYNTQCSVSGSQGSLRKRKWGRGCVWGGWGPQGYRVLGASHSRCGKKKLSRLTKHRQILMALDLRGITGRGTAGNRQGQSDSGRVWMMSWAAPFSWVWRWGSFFWMDSGYFLGSRRPPRHPAA